MIAGWNPDETYWMSDTMLSPNGELRAWQQRRHDDPMSWQPV